MKFRTIVLALAAVALLVIGAAAFAQPVPQPECQRSYRLASRAIENVYGLDPHVAPAQQLAQSMAFDDAALEVSTAAPQISAPLCSAERVAELHRLTDRLRVQRDELDPDRAPYQRRKLRERASRAVAQLAGD